jgi:hypothetical protein
MTQKWYQRKVLILPAVGLLIASASFAAGQITSSKQTITNPVVNKTEQLPSNLSSNKSVDAFDEEQVTIPSSFSFPYTSCGDKPTGNEDAWHPVFIDGAGIEDVRAKYCADAVATKRKDTSVETVQVASFTSRERALEFAKAVGGDVGEPTLAQSNSNNKPDQQHEVKLNPNEPTTSGAEIQKQVEIQQQRTQQQQVELAILEARSLCQNKYSESQQKIHEKRLDAASGETFFSSFIDSMIKGSEEAAQLELEICLRKAQAPPTP